uniref:hypothetical protein n=1 Tax=Thermoplasma acidophilum TaxID=2303 RepID=UPI0034E071AD
MINMKRDIAMADPNKNGDKEQEICPICGHIHLENNMCMTPIQDGIGISWICTCTEEQETHTTGEWNYEQ